MVIYLNLYKEREREKGMLSLPKEVREYVLFPFLEDRDILNLHSLQKEGEEKLVSDEYLFFIQERYNHQLTFMDRQLAHSYFGDIFTAIQDTDISEEDRYSVVKGMIELGEDIYRPYPEDNEMYGFSALDVAHMCKREPELITLLIENGVESYY